KKPLTRVLRPSPTQCQSFKITSAPKTPSLLPSYAPPLLSTMLPAPLNPPVRTLMGPGPSDIHPRVLRALAAPTVGHLDPYYLQLMNEMQEMLRAVFRTKNPMTMAVSATGSAGMESAVVNLIEP